MTRASDAFLRSTIDTRLRGSTSPKIPTYSFRGMNNRLPSKDTGVGVATAKETKVYTGTNMLGVATLHKSNAVPVFSQESAIEIAHMRR